MRFEWKSFFDRYRISYVTSGPNLSRDNLGIKCPFCGSSDSSEHMGVSLRGRGWGCWRNARHRGIRPHKLIQALLQCSYGEACRIAGDEPKSLMDTDDGVFGDYISGILDGTQNLSQSLSSLDWPKEIRRLEDKSLGSLFVDYLIRRKYKVKEIDDLVALYDLRYAVSGPFAYRLIIPVVMEQGLVSWTGRAISDKTNLRYKTLTHHPERAALDDSEPAKLAIDKCLWNYAELLEGGKHLVTCEGPLDAIRIDYFGRSEGIRATCLFGTGNLSEEQILLLDRISPLFKKRSLVLDRDASLMVLQKQSQLDYLGFGSIELPEGYDDPAVLPGKEIPKIFTIPH